MSLVPLLPPSRLISLRIVLAALVRIAAVALVVGVAACASRGRAPIEERSPRPAPPAAAPAPAPETPAPSEGEARPQTYTVKKGDTLHAIALDNGLDYRELAAWNNIENPNKIVPGQVLRIAPPGTAPAASTGVQTMPLRSAAPVQSGDAGFSPPAAAAVAAAAAAGGRNTESYKTQPKAIKEPYSEQALRDVQRAAGAAPAAMPAPAEPAPPPTIAMVAPPATATPAEPRTVPKAASAPPDDREKLDWGWPAKGKVVTQFSDTTSLKGIDIAGSAGQPVTASAGGKVVYAGSGLRGYGKLIIIKHNDAYLSAYAHNRDILVKEGQQVVKGQKIAEMGNTDTDQVKLHFEIRRQGKPVDPLRYLPPA
jgi:lipoprotein NlpD